MTNWTPDLTARPGPRYRAIADAIADDVAAGRLSPGTRLPPQRDLAYRLKVTVGTVTRAYGEAERRGLIGGEVGRGTFVRGSPHPPSPVTGFAGPDGDGFPAGPAPMIDLTVSQPSLQDLAGAGVGVGPAVLRRLADEGGLERLLRYQPHGGVPAHRSAGAAWLARQGVETSAERVIVTSGGQSGLALALLSLAAMGDTVLVEQLTYPGVKAMASTFGLRLQPVAIDGDGMMPDALDAACRTHRPRAIYMMPNLHNPTLATMPAERRRRIVAVAAGHQVPIVEDDVFGSLLDRHEPPLATLAPDQVLYVTSLSKSIAPGLRIGYLSCPHALIGRVEQVLRSVSWMASPLGGEIARIWIEDGTADRIGRERREETQARQALARGILGRHAGGTPPCAPHIWLRLPEPWRREEFAADLMRRGVRVALADAFVVGRAPAPHAVRVNVTSPDRRDDLALALRTIADVLARPDGLTLSIV
ncbi:MAG TPA: PLP-dependent aminotransferase family protein [Arenibaculum sp.]|nr:PLP-dependent aminotransferase family protein [Arenibaculum sp.]